MRVLSIILVSGFLLAGCVGADRAEVPAVTPAPVQIEKIVIRSDRDGDGIFDLDDIVQGARFDVANKSNYKDAYYSGGYPPEDEGVCTDVIWRAFKNAGYDLKSMMDQDIGEMKKNIRELPENRIEISILEGCPIILCFLKGLEPF